jgi:hypothetical protein
VKGLLLILLLESTLLAQTQGVVLDATTGAPLPGAYVAMYTANPSIARTDSAGHFRLERAALPIQVTRAGYLDAPNVMRQGAQDLVIRLTPEAVISGKLEDQDGFPVVGAQVGLFRYLEFDGERRLIQVRMTVSNDLGEYRIGALAAARYYLRVSGGSAANWDSRYVAQFFGRTLQPSGEHVVEVKAGERRDRTDMRLEKFEGVTVSGWVEGVPGSSSRPPGIHLRDDSGMNVVFPRFLERNGTFSFSHVTPGRYTLIAQTGSDDGQPGDLRAEIPLEVSGADVRDLVLRPHVIQTVDVPGTIVVEGGGPPGKMLVSLRRTTGRGVSAHSDENGSFVLKALPPGHYDIQVLADVPAVPETLVPKSARLGDLDVLRKGFDVDSQPLGPMKIALGKPPALNGKIVDAQGRPVAAAVIFFRSSAGTTGAISDAEGAFHSLFRAAGEYQVYVLPDQNQDAIMDPDYLQQHQNDLPVVRVLDGDNSPIVLKLTLPR